MSCLWRFLSDEVSWTDGSAFLSVLCPGLSWRATVAVSLQNSADDAVSACLKESPLPQNGRYVLKVAGRRSFLFGKEQMGRFEHVSRRTKVLLLPMTEAVLFCDCKTVMDAPHEMAHGCSLDPQMNVVADTVFFYDMLVGPWEWGPRIFERVTLELVFRKQVLGTFDVECGHQEPYRVKVPLHVCPPGTRVLLKAHFGTDSPSLSAVQFLLLNEETGATPIGRHQVFLWNRSKVFEEGVTLEPTCGYGKPSEDAVSVWVDFGEQRLCWRYERDEQADTTLPLSPGHMQNIAENPYHDLDSKQHRTQSVWNDRIRILAAHTQCLALVARCAPNFAFGLLEQYPIGSTAVALDLLGPEVGDFGMRSSAVAFFGRLSDSRLSFFLPQLVAVLRHEAQPLTCPLVRMLLKRGVENPAQVGSEFYWLLFPDDLSAEHVFAQVREAYKARISPCDRGLIVEQENFFRRMRNLQEVIAYLNIYFAFSFSDQSVRNMKSDERLLEFRQLISKISLPERFSIGSVELASILPGKSFLADSRRLPLHIRFLRTDGAGEVEYRFSTNSTDAMHGALCMQVGRVTTLFFPDNKLFNRFLSR